MKVLLLLIGLLVTAQQGWAQPIGPQNEIFTNRLVTKVVDYTIITAPPLAPQGACRTYVDGASLYMSCSGSAYVAFGIAGAGAPTNAQYWVGAADGTLSAEKNLGALATGLVINTAGVPTAYTGTSCTNQFPRSLSASGAATCASVSATTDITGTLAAGNGGTGLSSATDDAVMVGDGSAWQAKVIPDCDDTAGNHLNYDTATNTFTCGTSSSSGGTVTTTGSPSSGNLTKFSGATSVTNADLTGDVTTSGTVGTTIAAGAVTSAKMNITTTSCSNQFVSALSSGAVGTCTTPTLASAQFANQGTTTTVLHGNAAGNPSFGQVSLTADVTGNLPTTNLNSGTSAGATTFWRGDGTWATPAGTSGGAGTVKTYTNIVHPALNAGTLTHNSLTVRQVAYFQLPYTITVNQLSIQFTTAATPGTFKVCIYDEAGTTKVIDQTITPVAGTTVSSGAIGTTLTPGGYYLVTGCATTCSVAPTATVAPTAPFNVTATPAGKIAWYGSVTHTSGTCNTTLGTMTNTTNGLTVVRLDN